MPMKPAGCPASAAVLTYEDLRPLLTRDRISLALPSGYLRFDVDPFMLVKDEATYVGEPIALVVAQSRALAEDAAAAVAVEYEALPAVVDVLAALEPGSAKARLDCPDNVVAQTVVKYGDSANAFARAKHVFSEKFRIHKGGGHSLEGRGVIACFDQAADLLHRLEQHADAPPRQGGAGRHARPYQSTKFASSLRMSGADLVRKLFSIRKSSPFPLPLSCSGHRSSGSRIGSRTSMPPYSSAIKFGTSMSQRTPTAGFWASADRCATIMERARRTDWPCRITRSPI